MFSIFLLHSLSGHLLVTVAAVPTGGSSAHVSVGGAVFRILLSLFVILGVIWALAQYMKRRGMPGAGRAPRGRVRGSDPSIEVVTRQPLGKDTALVAIRVGAKLLLLGVTTQSVTTLGELDPDVFAADGDPDHTPAGSATPLDRAGRPGSSFPSPVRQPPRTASGNGRPPSTLERLRELTTRRS